MNQSPASINQFVQSLDLPEMGPRLETVETPPQFSEQREVVAVGSQLTEFDTAVSAAAREPIANALLLAQLAANKAASQSADVFGWYAKYNEVLQGIGWHVSDSEFQTQTIQNKNSDVHKEIIPVVTAMLGPQVAAVSMVVSVLKGLQNMNEGTPWIKIFDRSSEHARGAKFQVSYVDLDPSGNPQITAMCFGVQADKTITQVLFFKFASHRAEIKNATTKMSASMPLLNATKGEIAARVQVFISDFVKNIEI
jgi:hypothetical protein